MPTSTTKAAPAAQPKLEGDLKEYVVLGHAITFRTGRAKSAVRRFVQRERLILHSNEERVQDLVRQGMIGLAGERHRRPTARSVFAAMGADSDPARPPDQEFVAVDANAKKPVTPSE